MLAKKVLLHEEGSDEALQQYYADQTKNQQQKQALGKIAQAIDMLTEDVLGDYYEKWVNNLLDLPSGGNSSTYFDDEYTQYSGFYQMDLDGVPRPVSLSSSSDSVFVNAPDFSIKISAEVVGAEELGAPHSFSDYNSYSNGVWYQGFTFNLSSPSTYRGNVYLYTIKDCSGVFSSFSGRQMSAYWTVDPTVTRDSRVSVYYGINSSTQLYNIRSEPTSLPSNTYIGSWGGRVTLPDGTLGEKPWEYYNTTFLPWVKNECDNLGFDYRLITPYPDGYTPPVDPTEPGQAPTIPLATIPYNPFYEVATETHTEIVEVTDESGEVIGTEIEVQVEGVTDAEGADEYQYQFKIPELPYFKIPDIQVPTDFSIGENLANVCGGIWSTIYNFLDESGFLAIVIPALTIGLLLFILRYLGG